MGDKMKKSRNEDTRRRIRWNQKLVCIVYIVLRVLVLVTMVLQIVKRNYENVYICLLTLILFMIPSFVERRLRIELPDTLEIVLLIFIFAAEILGEIREYYLTIPCWDTILHTVNGFLFAAVGFSVVSILNKDIKITLQLSPFYMAIAAFCFSMTIGILWEFFEWGMDSWFGLDMQKDTVVTTLQSSTLKNFENQTPNMIQGIREVVLFCDNGSQLTIAVGGYLDIGLHDTMLDLLVNFIGAATFSLLGYFYVANSGKGRIAAGFIPKVMEGADEKNETNDKYGL